MATIKLFKNVPWSQGGFHVLRFPNLQSQETYFSNLESITKTANYDPRPGADLNLDISLMEARQYNYLSWEDETNGPLYYFIEDYEYLNDYPTTRFIISEDIWQNNHLRMSVNPCTVHRRHMPRWNGSQPILYPVDEGTPRSMKYIEIEPFQDGRVDDGHGGLGRTLGRNALVICTSKKLEDEDHPDGIFYYLTWENTRLSSSVDAPGGKAWMEFTSPKMNTFFEKWGVGLSPIVSVHIIPYCTLGVNYNSSTPSFQSLYGSIVEPADTSSNGVLFAVRAPYNGANAVEVPNPIAKPSRNTSSDVTASIDYEPQAWADNVMQYTMCDNSGSSAITIPNDWAYKYTKIAITNSVFSLNPCITMRFMYEGNINGTMADGMAINLPCVPVDIPQSQWADYVAQAQSAERQILENNISNRYLTTTVSGLTGAFQGGAYGGMYAESFNNSKRSPMAAANAGILAGAIQGAGSLLNAYIQTGTDRDNFKLNEQKIKNTPAPPIAGSNPSVMVRYGNTLGVMTADEVSREIIWNQYRYYGVIVDKAMPVTLRSRMYYDYLQTRDATVSGAMTSDAKSYLESLLNRGVTIWHAEAGNMYNYNYDNIEVA